MASTHTYATLEVSGAAYDEIRKKLEDAGAVEALRVGPGGLPMKARDIDSEWHVHVAGPGRVDVEMKCEVSRIAFTVPAEDAAALGRLLSSVARRAIRTDPRKATAIATRLLKRGRRG